MSFSDLEISTEHAGILIIRLTRAEARNALRNQTLADITQALNMGIDRDDIRCVVITGSESVFAAGADIKEMQALDPVSSLSNPRAEYWKAIRQFPKPLIAAVNGYALGGGCELMMHCDVAIAGDNAMIGQPEINLGIIPGAGGTQRLVRAVGKPLAMQMILSGEPIKADAALAAGLVAEVCPRESTLGRALQLAQRISTKSPLAIALAKEAILAAFEMPMEAGLELEHRAFAILTASKDRTEGIEAFMQKRKPKFEGR